MTPTPGSKAFVVETMRARLTKYEAGEKLPNVEELCRLFSVSPSTAVSAMRVLLSEGLVESRRGVAGGYFRTSRLPRDRATALRSVAAQLEEATEITRTVVDQLEEAAYVVRDASEPMNVVALIEDGLARSLVDYRIDSDPLPWDGPTSVFLVEVDQLEFHGDTVRIHAGIRLEAEIYARDAVTIDDTVEELDGKGFVTVNKLFKATIVVAQFDLIGGEIEMGSIQDIELGAEDD